MSSSAVWNTLRSESALEDRALVRRTSHLQGGIVNPASEVTVAILPHGVDQVGADGDILGVLDASVQEADLAVDEPVAARVGMVVEVLLLRARVLVDRPPRLDFEQSILSELVAVLLDRGRVAARDLDHGAIADRRLQLSLRDVRGRRQV